MKHLWTASYAQGVRLANAGCHLPHLDALPGKERFHQRALYVEQICGYEESFAFDWGASTGYAIVLRIGTERSRSAMITSFEFVPPWPDHFIDWDFHPDDVIPKILLKRYEKLIGSRLPAILNERRLLNRGVPVEGLLYGKAWAPIPPSPRREGPALAEINLVDDSGVRVSSLIRLTVYNAVPQQGKMHDRKSSGIRRTFATVDLD
jgi:hypothetical protein